MSGRYYTELVDVLEFAGVECRVGPENAGWETRARSSGGFAADPLGLAWHHTASSTTPENDLAFMCHGSDDAPIGNLLLDRDGVVWPIAAGAANTQGKGGPWTFSRGTVPVDAGNSQIFGLEVANNGIGERWPSVQIDAYFAVSNALSALFGNLPTDVLTHAEWTLMTRKVDPATAAAVQGFWLPASVNSSGTWSGDDIRHECARRAQPVPIPPPTEDPTMLALDFGVPGHDPWWTRLTYTGAELVHVVSPADQLQARGGVPIVAVTEPELSALLQTVQTVGASPFGPGGAAPNAGLDSAWLAARGRM